MRKAFAALLFSMIVVVPTAKAQGIVGATVDGSRLTAGLELPGGIAADLTISFEEVVGLSPESLGLSAQLVSPTDVGLLGRLPALGSVSIPAGFPVLLTIAPPATGGLSFTGIASVELHTHNLAFSVGCPLRLFVSREGGPFSDITERMGMGSYRVRGTSGGFSEFLIVADLRPLSSVVNGKFDRLEDLLASYEEAIDAEVYASLADLLHTARTAWSSGQVKTSIKEVETFMREVEKESGDDILDVWRASGGAVNAAGYLRAAAGTLRFSLILKSESL